MREERRARMWWRMAWLIWLLTSGVVLAAPTPSPTPIPSPTPVASPRRFLPVTEVQSLEVRVAVGGSAPYVIQPSDGPPDGVSVRIWEEAAKHSNLTSRYLPCPSSQAALEMVVKGQADLAVGPLSITASKLIMVDFTQPYRVSRQGILTRARPPTPWERVRPFLSTALAVSAGVVATGLVLVGLLVWALEHRHNPEHFPPRFREGVAEGIWFALATMTSVGYGDRTPRTGAGRLVAGTWMVVASLAFSALTAGIATALTLAHLPQASIERPSMLVDRKVAVVEGTYGEIEARRLGATIKAMPSLDAAVHALESGAVEAVIAATEGLDYYLRCHLSEVDLKIAPVTFGPTLMGFALPYGSPIRQRLNEALLDMHENNVVDAIYARWLSDLRAPATSQPPTPLP